MSGDLPSTIAPDKVWDGLLDRLSGRTVLVIGGPGTGKTRLSEYLVRRLTGEAGLVGHLSADMGQPAVGVPTCLGLALTESQTEPTALWFIGDVSPRGNLLPTVVGTGRLAQRARAEGAQTVVIDTTGLVDGPLGRLLKYHKALAAGVDRVVAIQRGCELEPTLALLDRICPVIYRLQPVHQAENRSPLERKAYREARFREHLHCANVLSFDRCRLVGLDWAPGAFQGPRQPPPGTLVGLLDRNGFCLALGMIEDAQADRLLVYTPLKDPEHVACLQLGKMRLNRAAGFSEIR